MFTVARTLTLPGLRSSPGRRTAAVRNPIPLTCLLSSVLGVQVHSIRRSAGGQGTKLARLRQTLAEKGNGPRARASCEHTGEPNLPGSLAGAHLAQPRLTGVPTTRFCHTRWRGTCPISIPNGSYGGYDFASAMSALTTCAECSQQCRHGSLVSWADHP